jgi:hypothetical protein
MAPKPQAKSAGAQIDALMRQSKQITADLGVLKHEIGEHLPSPLGRGFRIASERWYLISEQAYNLVEKLNTLRKTIDPPKDA